MVSVIVPFVLLPDKGRELVEIVEVFLHSYDEEVYEEGRELILVDNGTDQAAFRWELEMMRAKADLYIRNSVNLGYGPAVNQGLKLAQGEWLIVANNDIEFLDDWVTQAIEAWGPRTGILSSHLIDHDPKRQVGREVAPWGYLFGGLWMTRRDILDEVGLLDEGYERGMFEDKDLAVRITRAGYEHVKAGWVKHVGNATWGKLPHQQAIYLRNKARFEAKWPEATA